MDSELFNKLLASAKEAVEIEKGNLAPARVTTMTAPNVKAIRSASNLTQDEFARVVGVSSSLVQAWEQNKRHPTGSSLKLLRVIEKQPALIDVFRAA